MRIGVNIPNELMRRLEPLKPGLNISQVCRDALTAKAESHERMLASLDDDGVRAAVENVWEQEKHFLETVQMDWEMLGYEDATSWVKAAGWDEWDELNEWLDLCKERNYPRWKTIFPPYIDGVNVFEDRLGELHARENEMGKKHRSFYHWNIKNRVNYDIARQEYMTAWLSYTEAVWELIRQREFQYRNRQLAQRAAPPEPEVPEHLFGDAPSQEEPPLRIVPHHAGYAPGVDPLKLNHLIGDLDVAEFLAKRERPQ